MITIERFNDYEQTSQELRLDGAFEKAKFTAGVYYFNNEFTQDWITGDAFWGILFGANLRNPDLGGPGVSGLALCQAGAFAPVFCDTGLTDDDIGGNITQILYETQETTSIAAFAQMDYNLTDDLTMTAGLRWTLDKKEFQRQMNPGGPCTDLTPAKDAVTVDGECLDARSTAWSRTGLPLTSMDPYDLYLPDSAYALNADLDDEWEKITYRLVADYQLTDEALLYGSYSTGFISGGYTEQCSSAETCIPYDEETNWNLEGGLKARWWEGKLQTNFAVYYTRYEDLIRSQVVPFTDAFGNTTQETVNVNVGESTAYGMEAEISWVVTDAFRLDLTGAYLKHEYEDFTLDGYGDLSDLDVPYSPEWMWSAAGLYDWNLDSAGSVTLNVSANYQSEAEMSVFNSLYSQMDSRLLVDAALTWRDADERYKVTFWGKNLTDEEYRIGANPVAGLWNFTYYGRPMSYGVEIGAYF